MIPESQIAQARRQLDLSNAALVFEGDSLSNGDFQSDSPSVLTAAAASEFSTTLEVAENGKTTADIVAQGSTRIDPTIGTHSFTAMNLWIGAAAIIKGETVPTLRANFSRWIDERRTAGAAYVVASTLPPMTWVPVHWPSGSQFQIDAAVDEFNTWLASDSAHVDKLNDLSAIPELQIGGPGRNADGVHLTSQGNQIVADIWTPCYTPDAMACEEPSTTS